MYSKRFITGLGGTLAFTAGAINAGGFLALGHYTSHMTGIASSIADYIILHNIKAAVFALGFLLSFILGAATTSLMANYVRIKYSFSEYTPVLILEGILLFSFSLLWHKQFESSALWSTIFILLLCFVMGLQNAAITKISKSRIRTTHITGLLTDIGIGVGRHIFARFSAKTSVSADDDVSLYSFLVITFITGGISGVFLYQELGFSFTIPLAAVLLALATATTYYKTSN